MNQWEAIRALARRCYAEVRVKAKDHTALALIRAAEEITGIRCRPLPANDPLLAGADAVLDPDSKSIWFNEELEPELAAYHQVHEFAHHWIDDTRSSCRGHDLDSEELEERVPLGIQRIEGYSPRERRECQANVFAREYLLPCEVIERWFLEGGLDAIEIAARVGVPKGMVFQQLMYALLIPRPTIGTKDTRTDALPSPDLDPSQKRAAYTPNGPLLLEAGPGTGKTKTLVGRILWLLQEQKVSPDAILALTFSNKAAEEMRERVARVVPEAAPHIWMGTFHAFGLELLRKYGSYLGLDTELDVLDPASALYQLERLLPSLQLNHYQSLYEPTFALRDLLNAVSKAKDWLVPPREYLQMATRMGEAAKTEIEIEQAEKALEVAAVYQIYQNDLDSAKKLDFGDLIFRSVTLLQLNASVRDEIRRHYRHTLVDEYQDVNRASSVFLQQIAGEGKGLWVVGDIRQSIYRFRGAAPVNMRNFAEDFPGAQTLTLEWNYRSQSHVVDAFATLAPKMRASLNSSFTPWKKSRTESDGQIIFEVADNHEMEGETLAREIQHQHTNGIAFRDQAVLCRSHTALARIAEVLERNNVPVLYLGDIFERAEVRDLLALVSLTCEVDGRGLIRVARFKEYSISLVDVQRLLESAHERQVPFPTALSLAADAEDISDGAKVRFALLKKHLEQGSYSKSAWELLAHYLFVRSSYLRVLLADKTVAGQQRRLALYQFLLFVHQQQHTPLDPNKDPKQQLLDYVRRLEIFGEEKQLRQMPGWANTLDAVRLLTVHASKGLEFRAVYIPSLGQGHFPARRQPNPCPPPVGMVGDGTDEGHDEEEQCLFFVALSRARDILYLSRALQYGKRNSNSSNLLDLIAEVLPQVPTTNVKSKRMKPPTPVAIPVHEKQQELPVFDVEALDLYLLCPRRYFYKRILNLIRRAENSPYLQFHHCVYQVIQWIQTELALPRSIDKAEALTRLAEVWQTSGPVGHAYESLYFKNAQELLLRALRRSSASQRLAPKISPIHVPVEHGSIRFTPDAIEIREDGTEVIQRIRTGRLSRSEKDKDIYALYKFFAETDPTRRRQAQIISLSSDTIEDVSFGNASLKTRLARYDEAIQGILAESFPPQPNDRECPRCPFYFICPVGEDH